MYSVLQVRSHDAKSAHSLDTDLSRLQYVTYKLHYQALSDIIGTERSSEVWFDSKCDVRSNESLGKVRDREWCDYVMFGFLANQFLNIFSLRLQAWF